LRFCAESTTSTGSRRPLRNADLNFLRTTCLRVAGNSHEFDCKFILQLSHGGRQRDIAGIEQPDSISSTDKPDPLHGFTCRRMTTADIRETVEQFAQGARRAREAGLDGVELHSANGYLFTQFLSSATNDRNDEYGGSLENRARFLLDVVRAIRKEVGSDFHLQAKISATESMNAPIT
jgi:2,4-dienoyl-CoA reductase-like NADH-dependent reductase (Old Yellow Enzyme family)